MEPGRLPRSPDGPSGETGQATGSAGDPAGCVETICRRPTSVATCCGVGVGDRRVVWVRPVVAYKDRQEPAEPCLGADLVDGVLVGLDTVIFRDDGIRERFVRYTSLMATPELIYRHEYVSGVVIPLAAPCALVVAVANRGVTGHYVRLSVWTEGKQLPKSGDELVGPGGIWQPEPLEGIKAEGLTWVRLRTTSLDLVPSVDTVEEELSPTTGEVLVVRHGPYQAPGDFAVFDLHPIDPLPRPPVGPVEALD